MRGLISPSSLNCREVTGHGLAPSVRCSWSRAVLHPRKQHPLKTVISGNSMEIIKLAQTISP